MPQMKPMNWIILFNFMNLTILFLNIKNYFYMLNNLKKMKYLKNPINTNNWKW